MLVSHYFPGAIVEFSRTRRRIFKSGGGATEREHQLNEYLFESRKSQLILPAVISIHSIHLSKGAGGRPLAPPLNCYFRKYDQAILFT